MLNRYFEFKIMYSVIVLILFSILITTPSFSQLSWENRDSDFGLIDLNNVHVFKSSGSIDGSPFIAFYVSIDANTFKKRMIVDTSLGRRLTPSGFFQKNGTPLIVMNCSFFEFKQNRNVNLIVQRGKMVSFDTMPVSRRGKDTLTYAHHFGSSFGIFKNGDMDIVYNYNDSSLKYPLYSNKPIQPIIDSIQHLDPNSPLLKNMKPWRPYYAFGGGPSLLQNGVIQITNNEERKFAGKAIADKHPRTGIGYTADGKMILLVVQGRMKNIADGATLPQMAQIFRDLKCEEAMNLDGGGSSCLLVNGKETIKPSDPEGQRPVPAVLIIK